MASLATSVILGRTLVDLRLRLAEVPYFGVKEAVFPFNMFPEADPVLGPEMRSTGEVLGLSTCYGLAFFKAQDAAKSRLPVEGTVLISVSSRERPGVLGVARRFVELGFRIKATDGTRAFLADNGIASEAILKLTQGRPNIVDAIMSGEIQLVINTPAGKLSQTDDSYIRKSAIKYRVPYITTLNAALAAAEGIATYRSGRGEIKSLQEYHAGIRYSQ
jgi:carbamoyl-phosphate synthase large subunit